MATRKQIEANRLKARKSMGPRSIEGRGVSSQNALKTGIDAQSIIILQKEQETEAGGAGDLVACQDSVAADPSARQPQPAQLSRPRNRLKTQPVPIKLGSFLHFHKLASFRQNHSSEIPAN